MKTCTCANCGTMFERYNMNASRLARPQYCSTACLSVVLSDRAKAKQVARLWSRIDVRGADECWPWMGRCDQNGYGRIDLDHRPQAAHRVVYRTVTGESPPSVCHHCDNPPCCNPAHLFGGTQADNSADMVAKGRQRFPAPRRGRESNMCRLSENDVLDIFASSLPQRELAKRYSVSQPAIGLIKRGKNWGWLTGARDVP